MMGTPGACVRMRWTSSMPSISGIQMSTMARRGGCCASTSSAIRPFSASTTSNPSSESTPRSVFRICASSSTTRIVSAMRPPQDPYAPRRARATN